MYLPSGPRAEAKIETYKATRVGIRVLPLVEASLANLSLPAERRWWQVRKPDI